MNDTIGRTVNRRRLIGGIGAAGLATAVGSRLAFAQESTPTGAAETATDTPLLDELLARADEEIAAAQADRAAVTGIDFTIVDQLIDQAVNLRDQAVAATDRIEQARFALAAIRAANSSGATMEALLSDFGLPSKQTRSSVVLAAVHEGLTELATEVGSENADAVAFVGIAEALYGQAYDAYNAGTYASATRLALTAGRVGSIAVILTADGLGRGGLFRRGDKRGRRERIFGGDGPFGDGPDFDDERPAAPVEVPAPTFV